jgi:hypothetical protein
MATVTGLTADRMQEIIDSTIVDADVIGGNLILTKDDGSTVNAGSVVGPQGTPGTNASNLGKGNAFPAGASDGDLFVRTDMVGDPLYKFTDGAWVISAGGLSKVTTFPPVPTDGDVIVRTDLNGSPLFAYSTENGWEPQPRMGAVTVPSVRATATASAVPHNVATVVSLPTEDYDTDGMHDLVTNNSRVTVKTPGIYSINATLDFAGSTAGSRRAGFIRINGTLILVNEYRSTAGTNVGDFSFSGGPLRLAAGDYVEILAYQDIGTPLNTAASLTMVWIGGAGQTVDERGVPAVRATLAGGTQSVATTVAVLVGFPTEDFDTENIHDTVANTTRLTIKTPGLYQIEGYTEPAELPVGNTPTLNVYKNGTLLGPSPYMLGGSSNTGRGRVSGTAFLVAGDYLELQFINAGNNTLTISRAYLSAVLVGSGRTVTPFALAWHSAAVSIPNDVFTTLALDSEVSDNDAIHDTVTNNSRLTCRTAGVYSISGRVGYVANTTGLRGAKVLKNGTTFVSNMVFQAAPAPDGTYVETHTIVELAVGDYVELQAWQKSGGALNTLSSSGVSPSLSMVKIGAPLVGGTGIGPAQSDAYTLATLPGAATVPAGRIVLVTDGAAGQQARMSTGSAWINLG